MKKASHLEEYVKALRVLSSCETTTHVKGARRYFDLYLNKWKHLFARDVIENMSVDFKILVAKNFEINPKKKLKEICFFYRFIVLFEGNFKRNYIHLKDVVQAFDLAINFPEKFKGQIFNVGLSNANISKNELCEKIKHQLPDFVYFNSDIGSDPDKRNYLVSNEKIESTGFKHTVDLDEGIAELIKGLPIFQNKQFSNV